MQTLKETQHHASTNAHIPIRAMWESGEHVLLGDSVNLMFPSGKVPAYMIKLVPYFDSVNSLYHAPDQYTFGEVLALAGDFIGIPEHPISDSSNQSEQFNDNYSQLCFLASNDKKQVASILELIHREIDMLNKATDPSKVYEEIGDSFSLQWNVITGGENMNCPFSSEQIPNPFKLGRYLQLATMNWDHFGYRAALCYKAGHTQAVLAAQRARNAPPQYQERMLESAYSIDAFSCHYLTDMFSSGHMRTPRKELYDSCGTTSGGLLARAMHDQDSKIGLNVHNAVGLKWTAYGDGQLLMKENFVNMIQAKAAVQASADEIWAAFSAPSSPISFNALNYAPLYEDSANTNGKSPLFMAQNQNSNDGLKVYVRTSADLNDYNHTTDWHIATTLAWCVANELIRIPCT